MGIIIRKAKKEDAPFLAKTVMEAIGPELSEGLAEGKENLPKVEKLFTDLASATDSQYSFLNALIAEDEETGETIGAIISYDGARLRELRAAFIREANRTLGWNVSEEDSENWEDECGADEIYIDSLYIDPAYRKMGIATRLINEVIARNKNIGKSYGILVEPSNEKAYRLYRSLGFQPAGINRFCRVPMHHLQLRNSDSQ